jgi:hypothetical protein
MGASSFLTTEDTEITEKDGREAGDSGVAGCCGESQH